MTDKPSLEKRFWAKVDRRGPDECWPWVGSSVRYRRGLFYRLGKRTMATWTALELAGRPRPSDKHDACHTCDNPNCVNPAHLWWGTKRENTQDMVRKGRHHSSRKTHCPHGHALAGENLVINSSGLRECLTCRRSYLISWRRKRQCSRAAMETDNG